jgi:hypothetical protein
MPISGNTSIATYFVLNKKDRTGKVFSRPFQIVFDEMKRQDTEDAKKKQQNSLKGVNEQNLPPSASKENGLVEVPTPAPLPPPPPPAPENPTLTGPAVVSAPVKIVQKEEVTTYLTQSSIIKPTINDEQPMKRSEMINELDDPRKSFNQQSRSRACELL